MTETDAEKAAGSRLDYDLMMAEEYILSDVEKNFILACERGDLPGVKKSVPPHVLFLVYPCSCIHFSCLQDTRGVYGNALG